MSEIVFGNLRNKSLRKIPTLVQHLRRNQIYFILRRNQIYPEEMQKMKELMKAINDDELEKVKQMVLCEPQLLDRVLTKSFF